MNLGNMLGVMILAGALGAVAGGAVSFLGQGGAEPESNEVLDRLTQLQRDVDGLRDSARESRKGVGDLEERLVSAEMDLTRMTEESRAALAANPAVAGVPTIEMPTFEIPTVKVWDEHLAKDLAAKAQERAAEMRKQFARSMELRALPEERRWDKATDELGLTTSQVDEIKAAKTEFDAAMKDATTSETTTTDDGATMTFRRMDGNKVREARTRMDERIGNTLNSEQKDRWNSEGWKGAMTGSGPARARRVSMRRRGGDHDGDHGGGDVEVITIGVNADK